MVAKQLADFLRRDFHRGVPAFAASVAVAPAACPMAVHGACSRSPEFARFFYAVFPGIESLGFCLGRLRLFL